MKNDPKMSVACPFCHVQPDTQLHSVQCNVVKSKINVRGNYRDIFQDNVSVEIIRTLMEIRKLRENLENQ